MLPLIVLPFALYRLTQYLRFLQQDEYSAERFCRWFFQQRAWDKVGTLILMAAGMGLPTPIVALLLWGRIWYEGDPRKEGKIPLKMTARAGRILKMSATLMIGVWLFMPWSWLYSIVAVQAVPVVLLAASAMLWPSELRLQKTFKQEATKKIRCLKPKVIAITGSYGKTSVKHALGHLLQLGRASTFWPDGGINTPMGIVRAVREKLEKHHQYAVIETGAYQKGTIAGVCEMVQPIGGIITAIGEMHLERFGSREAIFKAKCELAQGIPDDGILVCCGDDPGARRAAEMYPKKTTLLYGQGPADARLITQIPTLEGTEFVLEWDGSQYRGKTKLLGQTALLNMLGAFTMACALGVEPEWAVAILSTLEPVDNRLQLDRQGDVVYLRDAYNSNPKGFHSALDLMDQLPSERKILMTPGVVELGAEQYEANKKMAEQARSLDIVIQVGTTNRAAWLEGVAKQTEVLCFEHRDEALTALQQMSEPGDLVLIENDLPDWYEHKQSF